MVHYAEYIPYVAIIIQKLSSSKAWEQAIFSNYTENYFVIWQSFLHSTDNINII